jgi:hypothetical protein
MDYFKEYKIKLKLVAVLCVTDFSAEEGSIS